MAEKNLDMRLGQRLRTLRKIRRLTQKELAKRIGISFQQLQKNEKGDNQISCSRLTKLAKALDVDVDYFFTDLYHHYHPQEDESELQFHLHEPAGKYDAKYDARYDAFKSVISNEGLKLISAYESIQNAKLKKIIKEFIDILAKSQQKK